MSSIFSRFELSSFKRMYTNALHVHHRSGIATLFILLDMANCIINYHIGYLEYNLFHFENKSKNDRMTYVNFDYSQNLFKQLNNQEYSKIFNDKLAFNKLFKDYLGRDFLDIGNCCFEEFEQFCQNKKKIFAKPVDSFSGKGIYQNFEINNQTDLRQLFDYFKQQKLFVEDSIVQNQQMSKLHPSSINTIRVTTVLDKNDVPHVMYALLRIGVNGAFVDNVGSGGIYTVLNKEGKIVNPCWSDKTITTYEYHPTTSIKLIGFEIPFFEETLQLCKKAALVEKHVRYVGWDIAIGNNGPIIVEGNPLPGYDMPQNYFASGKDIGMKPDFERILKC